MSRTVDAPIYLDCNATTPVDPRVVEAMLPFLDWHFGNPSSAHVFGRTARAAVERAREQVARLIGARPAEIVFTSGGSEANNLAIKGAARRRAGRGRTIVTSSVEHPAVVEPLRVLAEDGFEIVRLPVDRRGYVDPRQAREAIGEGTILVSVMHANNEVGTIEPVSDVAAAARAAGAVMHTDAAQSVGKVEVDVGELDVDLLSIAGHKLYAPKGVGALYVREGIDLAPLIDGAAHEAGRRAGTENVAGIVGLGVAAEIAAESLAEEMAHARALRDRLRAGLKARLGHLVVHGDPGRGLPGTLSVAFDVPAAALLAEVGDVLAASAGAACHADGVVSSPVLEALGVPPEVARRTVRLSVGRMNTVEEVDRAVEILAAAAEMLRARGGPAA